jgi:IS30 family transposase
MKYRTRRFFSEADKVLMWDRWQKGDSLHSIARFFDSSHSAISGVLSRTGGIRPRQRQRSERALTLVEREEISRGVVAGQSLRWIAASLGRAPSTVSREIKRNGGRRQYRASKADEAAWDRGKEMADHERFSLDTDIKVYFCDPQSPWQRGSNENTNGLLRQYFPKGMDLSNIHQNRLNAVARRLNERPRKTLEYRTPAERFAQCVASTN